MNWSNGEYNLQINGLNHWVKIEGAEHNTKPLILLHGGPGGNHYVFERTIGPMLSTNRTIIYYEQRGSGRSEKPALDEEYSIELLISDFQELKKSLAIEGKVDLLGYSFGAELALEIAYNLPNEVNKLLLSGPSLMNSSLQSTVQIAGFFEVANSKMLEEMNTILAQEGNVQNKLDQIWELVDQAIIDSFLFENQAIAKRNRELWKESGLTNTGLMMKALQEHPQPIPLINRLMDIKHPCLLITGIYDRNTGILISRPIHRELPNSQWEIFHHSAHFPDLEESEKFAAVSLTFLND